MAAASIPDGKGGFVVQKFLTPQWELVTPFAPELHSILLAIQEAPAQYESNPAGYIAQADELITLSAQLSDRAKSSEYWALGPGTVTPPGRWFEFAQYISARDQFTPSKTM